MTLLLTETTGCGVELPLPLRATVDGLPAALWVTTSDAVRLPLAAGAKATSTLQLAPAAMALPQLVAICRNSLACAPVMAMPLSASGALPLLLTRTVCAADTVPV